MMEYRSLGRSGLKVSLLCLGAMNFGGPTDEATAQRIVGEAREDGVNFIDTADQYAEGRSEAIVGRAIAASRDAWVLATKVCNPMGSGPNDRGLSRKWLMQAADASLKRLGTDYIDIYYLHKEDHSTPLDETVRAMGDLVRAGKVRKIGLSEAAPDTIRRAAQEFPIAALQTEYSLWTRDPEDEILPLCRELDIGFVAYSPLGRGFLTGRFRSIDDLPPDDYRRNSPRFQGDNFQKNLDLVAHVEEIARRKKCTPSQLALAWVLAQGEDIVPIPGTKQRKYLEENARALEVELTPSDLEEIEEIAPKGVAEGARYNEAGMKTVNG